MTYRMWLVDASALSDFEREELFRQLDGAFWETFDVGFFAKKVMVPVGKVPQDFVSIPRACRVEETV